MVVRIFLLHEKRLLLHKKIRAEGAKTQTYSPLNSARLSCSSEVILTQYCTKVYILLDLLETGGLFSLCLDISEFRDKQTNTGVYYIGLFYL